MGLDVRLLTALGDDVYAQKMTTVLRRAGHRLSPARGVPGVPPPPISSSPTRRGIWSWQCRIWTSIGPPDAPMCWRGARSRWRATSGGGHATPTSRRPTIAWLAVHCHAPVFADPVSTVKAVKVRPVLGQLHTLKPNRHRGRAAVRRGHHRRRQPPRCGADALLSTGLHRVFISLGADGVYAADTRAGGCKARPRPRRRWSAPPAAATPLWPL